MGLQNLVGLKAADLHDLLGEGPGHDIDFAVGGLHQDVLLVGVQGDGQVAGEGPDGGGPNDEEELAVVHVCQLALVVVDGELHKGGGAGVVLVLDLGLGQSGLVVGAPVDGLQALVDIALLVHFPKDLHLFGLKAGVHGQVGVVPVADDAHPLEALALHVHIVLGKLMAGGAELRHRHLLVVELVLLDDGGLNGHAVVVPAGDIGGVIAPHGVGANDDVLDGLVQGVAHVQGAVGEGRAVVKGEPGLILVLLQQLPVDVDFFPACQHFRLPLGQAGPHGEVGLWQIDGGIVILGHSVLHSSLSQKRNLPGEPARFRFWAHVRKSFFCRLWRSLAEFRRRSGEKRSCHFFRRRVRRKKYCSACQCARRARAVRLPSFSFGKGAAFSKRGYSIS